MICTFLAIVERSGSQSMVCSQIGRCASAAVTKVFLPSETLKLTHLLHCAKHYRSQNHTVTLGLRTGVMSIDAWWMYFQAPVKVEYALKRVVIFPAECDDIALLAEIRERFKAGPGISAVLIEDYHLSNKDNTNKLLAIVTRTYASTGRQIGMVIILGMRFHQLQRRDERPTP